METSILTINNLSKHFGRLKAVNNLSLSIPQGSVFGILGPNGSGKTTSLGMVLDVLRKTSGTYQWFDGKQTPHQLRRRVGAILEQPLFYPYLSAYRNLKIVAEIKEGGHDQIDEKLELVNLLDRKHDRFSTFSYGMKQRLAIAASLLNDPEVLILDEPTNGLDPQGIAEIRELIIKIAKQGITIILASHMLDEVQKVCSHVVVLQKGKKLFTGKVADVLQETKEIELRATDMVQLQEVVKQYPLLQSSETEEDFILARLSDGANATELNQYLIDKGITLSHLVQRKSSLEQYFLEITENNDH